MRPLSVFIITKNEEARLGGCLEAAQGLADEIIILDSGSTDQTLDIAKKFHTKTAHRDFTGFGQQKIAAQNMCTHDWVLNLDADEYLTPALQEEIKAFLSSPTCDSYDGAQFWIKGILPEKKKTGQLFSRAYNRIRLYNKTKLSFPDHPTFDNIDNKPEYKIHQFKNVVDHHSFETLESLEAKARERTIFYFESEKRGKAWKNVIRLPFEFIISFLKSYILRRQILGGLYGLKMAYIYAKYRHIRIAQRVCGRRLIH